MQLTGEMQIKWQMLLISGNSNDNIFLYGAYSYGLGGPEMKLVLKLINNSSSWILVLIHPGVQMGTGKLNAGGNPAMD